MYPWSYYYDRWTHRLVHYPQVAFGVIYFSRFHVSRHNCSTWTGINGCKCMLAPEDQ